MNRTIAIGDFRLMFVSGGRLRIDGGNMFGVIPRVLWAQKSPPDELNRIELDTNCILVRTPHSLGLIDTGYGGKATPKHRSRHALEEGEPLARNLAAVGIDADEIDWVILTHLHFDHAGGGTRRDEHGQLRPTFSRARYFVQRREWDDAMSGRAELAGSYYPDDFAPLEKAGLMELIDGHAEITDGVVTQLTGGHTRGHQIVRLESGDDSAVCLADICPTTAHLPTFWTMAYDQYPLDVRRVKPAILSDIAGHQRVALFSHDLTIEAARISPGDGTEWNLTAAT